MFDLTLPETEFFDDSTYTFTALPPKTYHLEHSLVSVSKWEQKNKKPFVSNKDKTIGELLDYMRCSCLTNISDEDLARITRNDIDRYTEYMNDPMTATTFSEKEGGAPSRKIVTSELIYYWMIASNIPFECEKWHLNRLLTLIKICGIKNQPPKKMSKKQMMSRNAALNKARRQKHNTSG